MKIVFSTMLASLLGFASFAQNPTEGIIRYQKQDKTGVTATYSTSEEVTQETILRKLAAAGIKDNDHKNGFIVFKGVTWPAITADKIDVYVKVDGNRNNATVNIMVAKGYDNFITSASDAAAIENLKTFLNSVPPDADAYAAELALKQQETKVKDAKEDYERSLKRSKKAARKEEKETKEKDKDQKKLNEEQEKMQQMKAG